MADILVISDCCPVGCGFPVVLLVSREDQRLLAYCDSCGCAWADIGRTKLEHGLDEVVQLADWAPLGVDLARGAAANAAQGLHRIDLTSWGVELTELNARIRDERTASLEAPGVALLLHTAVAARLACEGQVYSVTINDVIDISEQRTTIHQGCGRPPPSGGKVGARRLELDDGTVTWGVSGGHCRMWRCGDSSFVEDMGSDSGTDMVRDGHRHRVKPGIPAVLKEGNDLLVGRTRFRVVAARASPS